ncbi:aminotransferase class V-fold PLP-dependent enzyme [Paraburkholderia sp. JHI2823]|uniref:aminotransferase class V-fold PLP-dependent enzyme n=1 Tax=Paraburkholderia sp. JHI2823 TaxID=3112960 RepID=UPI00317AAA8B
MINPTSSLHAQAAAQSHAHSGWFMYHSVGVFPRQQEAVSEALSDFSGYWYAADDDRWDRALQSRRTLLDGWANLIRASPERVFAAQNVTEAFARFLDAIGETRLRERTVLVAADCFPSLYFLLEGLSKRYGFTLRTVPIRAGASYVSDDDYLDAWGDDVALALVTWVSSLTSKRADMKRLLAHASQYDSIVAVDITQGAGILPFDVRTLQCDFVCGSTLKWMCGAPGAGLAYVAPKWRMEALEPAVRGWFSQEDPFSWDLTCFQFASDARRFDTGTPSVLPYIASLPGLNWLQSQPPGALREHNLAMSRQIIALADRFGWHVLSPREDESRGGSVMLAAPDNEVISAVVTRLKQNGVFVDSRGNTLRISPGYCTDESGLQRLAQGLQTK